MESTSCVDTSLNLCIIPNSRHTDVAGDEELVEELNRLSNENKEISEKLRRMSEKYSALKKQYLNLSMKSNNNNNNNNNNHDCETDIIRKRKCDESGNNKMVNLNGECCSTTTINEDYYYSFKRPKDHTHTHTATQSPHHHNKVSKILVRTDASDPSLYVRDGYQWRKYGQKVTRDNPSPRAYFRCSHAPSCPVKKKVQRSVEDPSILVATYEGEHNHVDNINGISGSESYSSDQLIQRSGSMVDNNNINAAHTTKIQQFLVQQMASTLTRDPNFTSALANAISGRFLDNHT